MPFEVNLVIVLWLLMMAALTRHWIFLAWACGWWIGYGIYLMI
jgi:hypothetical protein